MENNKNNKNNKKSVGSESNFTFTVSDGFCTHSFPLNISNDNSIDDIVTKIYEAFELKKESGTLIKPYQNK